MKHKRNSASFLSAFLGLGVINNLSVCDSLAFLIPGVVTNHHNPSALEATTSRNDWRQYVKDPMKKKFQKSGGIIYRTSVFTESEFETIQTDVRPVMTQLQDETKSSVARNRKGASLGSDSETAKILRCGSLSHIVKTIMGEDFELSTRVPIEIRTYEKVGAGMEWHVDDTLFDPPQLEVVFTLENTSDCKTMWRLDDGSIQTTETDKNSVVLLTAGGVSHCVSSLKTGKRVILKCVYCRDGASFLEEEMVKQFTTPKKTKKK